MNVVQTLIFGLGTRILSQGFQIDFTLTNNIWCKLRVPVIYINTLSSYTFLCLQSIDAFIVTSLSILEELSYLFFQELIINSEESKAKYRTDFIYLFLTTIIPLILIILFDLLTYRHLHIHTIQQRRRLLSTLSRQMTTMTLFHIAAVFLFQAPFAVAQCHFLTVGVSKEPIRGAQEQIVQ